jgi:hypothetical protein
VTEADKIARQRAQQAVTAMCRFLKKKGTGLTPEGAFQRGTVHDAEIVVLIQILGELIPGGQAAVWDRIAKHAETTLAQWQSRQIEVVQDMPVVSG